MDNGQEHPSTYIVQDRSNQKEMTRLQIQDKMLTVGMGGVLPELADPGILRRVLDVGCGTGGWLIETARTYPTIEHLFGADISDTILAHARTQAENSGQGSRIQFQATDALRALPFSDNFFDLVNQRLGASWLRTWEWKKILLEYQRVLRPGGTVRITEMQGLIENNSPALMRLGEISLEVFFRSGRLFTPQSNGLTGELVQLLSRHRFENIQTHVHTIVLQTGTSACQYFYEDVTIGYQVMLPFFQKWIRVPINYQDIYQQALKEMQQPDFVATWILLTVWGTKPINGQSLLMRGLN
jgi:ubiquinone/menaquinone biosynthesis C-methylase UbiE